MPRIRRILVPSVSAPELEQVASALATVARPLGERRALAVSDGRLPPAADDTLRLVARALLTGAGTCLEIDDVRQGGPWDLALAQALSAAFNGFTVAIDSWRHESRYGEAVFFAGRTIEAHTSGSLDGDLHVPSGPIPTLHEVWTLYDSRFADLCRAPAILLHHGTIITAEDWSVGPPTHPSPRDEDGFALILLTNVDRARFEERMPLLRPGWRWRLHTSRAGIAYAELRRPGELDEHDVEAASGALECAALGVEVRGRGDAFRWVEAWRGVVEHRGDGAGAHDFALALHAAGAIVGAAPAFLFGRGNTGWRP